MSHGLPKSARVMGDHSATAPWSASPKTVEVHYTDELKPPLLARHLLFVIIDDAPMTRLLQAARGNPIPDPAAPGPPYTSQTGLLPQTPTLEALAAAGVTFRSLRVNVECSPTRATCLTGVYAFRHGIANVVNLNATQAGDLGEFGDAGFVYPTIFNTLRELGVRTSFVGKIHLSADYNQTFNGRDGSGWAILDKIVAQDTHTATTLRNLNQTSGDLIKNSDITSGGRAGYYYYALNLTRSNHSEFLVDSAVDGDAAYNTTRLVDEAISWWQTVDNSQRAFQWLAFNGTHTPLGGADPDTEKDFPPDALVATQEYKDLRDQEEAGGELISFWEDQQACMEGIDKELGRLLDSIPPEVRAQLTVVVIGDNGHDTISIPAARNEWGKDFGDDWNFVIDNNRMKGTLYHYGSWVEGLWSGPGIGTPSMLRAGEVVDFPVDAVDIPATIAEYFGGSMPPIDGQSFYEAIYVDPTIDYQTWDRRDQYSETFNPNGDWRDNLTTANDTSIQLQQSMASWFLAGNGITDLLGLWNLIRKRGQGGVADNSWHYELYQHYDGNHDDVDPSERVNRYGEAETLAISTEIEARIEALLNSSLGGTFGIEVTLEDGASTKIIRTVEVSGDEQIPVTLEDGTSTKTIPPGTVGGTTGMPVDNTGKVVPYVGTIDSANWYLRVDIETLGPFDKFIAMDQSDAMPVENSGGKVIPSTPGTPNTILVENSDTGSGDKVLLLTDTITP